MHTDVRISLRKFAASVGCSVTDFRKLYRAAYTVAASGAPYSDVSDVLTAYTAAKSEFDLCTDASRSHHCNTPLPHTDAGIRCLIHLRCKYAAQIAGVSASTLQAKYSAVYTRLRKGCTLMSVMSILSAYV